MQERTNTEMQAEIEDLRAGVARLEVRLDSQTSLKIRIHPWLTRALLFALLALPAAALAATISVPNTFVNGATADADEVNANFDALVSESNDQDSRIGALEASPAGTVTSVATGTGLTGGPISTSGTISVAPNGIGPIEISNAAVNFGHWSDNGCAFGQIPKWSGAAWQCGDDL